MTGQSSKGTSNTDLATTKNVVTNTVLQHSGAGGWGRGCRARRRWQLRSVVNVPSATELFTLKWLLLCHVNFTSIKEKYICNHNRKSSLNTSIIASLLEDVCKGLFIYLF